MCNKAVDNYPHGLKFVSDCYKTRIMCDKDISAFPSIMQFVPKIYKTQKISSNAVNRCFDVRDSIPDW